MLDVPGSDLFRYISFVKDDPDYDWNSFSFAAMPDTINDARAILDATEADLGPFHSAGGKLLSYFGWADPDINPLRALPTMRLWRQLCQAMSETSTSLFMVAGVVPDRLEARHLSAGKSATSAPYVPTLR